MKIFLNGTSHEIDGPLSVSALLESIGFGDKPVVVELDQQALFPRDFPNARVGEGSRVEIVALAAGG
ncbi:sulfur carrier protein ThiS [bacterium]|nr:sulfur carrier protein ThiS [bacterium]